MRRRTGVAVVAGALGLAVAAGPALADERVCRGAIGAETVDDLRVPDGASCTLRGTRVEGNVLVGTRARLDAVRIDVDGNVQSEGHRLVRVLLSAVDGDVQVEQGRSAVVSRNTIGGNLQSFSNRGAQTFRLNRIDGNLQCTQNRPAPRGGGNAVEGDKEDQCRRL